MSMTKIMKMSISMINTNTYTYANISQSNYSNYHDYNSNNNNFMEINDFDNINNYYLIPIIVCLYHIRII